MSQEFLKHLFDPFVQEKIDARSVYHGTGLGMSIVKGLVDKMNGTIEVESRQGEGSVFTVTIPFEIAPESDARGNTGEDGENSVEGVHVLLAEDNELNVEVARELLEEQGAIVSTVANGQEAVRLFEECPEGTFDVILMDVMMPVMDGLEATRRIRASKKEEGEKIPIIALTANAFLEDMERCTRAGMNAHLAKPIELEKMIHTIAGMTRKNG